MNFVQDVVKDVVKLILLLKDNVNVFEVENVFDVFKEGELILFYKFFDLIQGIFFIFEQEMNKEVGRLQLVFEVVEQELFECEKRGRYEYVLISDCN